jgi:predicted DsbA family dithiol-disulfide isomerase
LLLEAEAAAEKGADQGWSIVARSMSVTVRYFTDPACSWSWSTEPTVRKLMVEFGDSLRWTFVMAGLARDYTSGHEDPDAGIGGKAGIYPGLINHWLDVAERGRMPMDPRIWSEAPIASTYPACMAVKAAAEQADDAGYAYLRRLREGLMCFRRKLDTTESLVEEARAAQLNVERFRIDLGSHAIVEAFGEDLDEIRAVPDDARAEGKVKSVGGPERLTIPSAVFVGEDGSRHGVYGFKPYEDYAAAAEAAGAVRSDAEKPGVEAALRRFGRMATRELEVVCELPEPRAKAELWRLASDWRVKPTRVLTGDLWELA